MGKEMKQYKNTEFLCTMEGLNHDPVFVCASEVIYLRSIQFTIVRQYTFIQKIKCPLEIFYQFKNNVTPFMINYYLYGN